MPRPLKFTKPSCKWSLFIAEVEETCNETVSFNMWVFLVTLSEGGCVSFSKRSIFQLTRKNRGVGGGVEHQTMFVHLYQLALRCIYLCQIILFLSHVFLFSYSKTAPLNRGLEGAYRLFLMK